MFGWTMVALEGQRFLRVLRPALLPCLGHGHSTFDIRHSRIPRELHPHFHCYKFGLYHRPPIFATELHAGEHPLIALRVEYCDTGNDVAQRPPEGARVGMKPATERARNPGKKLGSNKPFSLGKCRDCVERGASTADQDGVRGFWGPGVLARNLNP